MNNRIPLTRAFIITLHLRDDIEVGRTLSWCIDDLKRRKHPTKLNSSSLTTSSKMTSRILSFSPSIEHELLDMVGDEGDVVARLANFKENETPIFLGEARELVPSKVKSC